MRTLQKAIFLLACFCVCIWVIGRIASDRWYWSQWLLWIPTLGIIGTLFFSCGFSAFAKNKKHTTILGFLAVFFTVWFLCIENRVFSLSRGSGDFKIVGWTMSHAKAEVSKESANIIVQLDADITILTHGWHVRGEPAIKDWLGEKNKRLISGPFTLLTTLRPLEVRTLVASDGMYISMYRVDARAALGKELVIYAVDLPFTSKESRKAIVQRTKRFLRQMDLPDPDLVVGDFNMTRNSNSMRRMFPTLKDAWDASGVGWSSSFHRAFPLFHIDHMLLGSDLHPVEYALIDPEFGRHCIQVLELAKE
ncbi:MAG: hypothetical protein QGI78_08000 [Phycisphaerales bacterium]|jgi:hypothetical protein|nr:hypothetical protein [Phycisphaerales bacterium]